MPSRKGTLLAAGVIRRNKKGPCRWDKHRQGQRKVVRYETNNLIIADIRKVVNSYEENKHGEMD